MSANEHWEVLGLGPDASQEEIKTAYRRLARENHPDRNPNDLDAAHRFRRAAEAYRALSSAFQTSDEPLAETKSEVLSELFGLARKMAKAKRGADTRFETSVSFLFAMKGGNITISVPIQEGCAHCAGSGVAEGSASYVCGGCKGTGKEAQARGFFSALKSCTECHGLGVIAKERCPTCNGDGCISRQCQLTITVPSGTKDGTRLRVPGRGQMGKYGGNNGDLYVVLKVREHPHIKRKGEELWVTVPVPFAVAVTGGVIPVPTIHGQTTVTIDSGTCSGTVYRLRGQGLNGHDQHVCIEIEVPKSVPDAVLTALHAYAELEKSHKVLRRTDAYLAQVEADSTA
ncbi:MAG: DnaJ domain-containing protein [Myxococcales bacterium]|nr:DnaJ domain-containing protein [Myxococcales bacterium]